MSEKLKYTNRKGQVWFFREVSGKRGARIACSQKETADDLESIPDTHEIVENPNGQVSCRKKMQTELLDEEIVLARERCPKLVRKGVEIFVEVKEAALVVHSREQSGLEGVARDFPGIRLGVFAALAERVPFEAMLKFELVDHGKRVFAVSRMSWMGEAEWLFLEDGKLAALLKKYVRHIEKESFYELF